MGTLQMSPVASAAQYTQRIDAFIALIFEAVDTTVEPTVSRLLLALFNLIEAKEYAGLERANGIRLLATIQPDTAEQAVLAQLIERQEQSLARFESFCGEEVRNQWIALQSTLPRHELERLRRQLLTPNPALSQSQIDAWFDVCSTRIDGFHLVERHLADLIETACHNRIVDSEAILRAQQAALDSNSALPDEWIPAATSTPDDHTNHEQRLGSRLNRALMDLLQQQSADLQLMSAELSSVRAALEDRKLIERAKGMLMAQQGVSEEVAYGKLRQKAMDQNVRISDVASTLLAMADFFPAPKRGS